MPGTDLQRQEERTARLVDELTDRFAVELGDVLKLLVSKIRTLVRQLQKRPDGRIVASQQNLALALALKADLIAALKDAGYADLARSFTTTPLDDLARHLLENAPRIDGVLQIGRLDVDTLVALKRLRLAELLQVGEDIAVTLWRIVVDGVLGLRPVVDLVQDIADALDISERRARQIYDTAVSTYSRQVDQLLSDGDADEKFFYVGPVDIRVRPFCWARVGKVFTRADIDAMDNGQIPNPMLTGGGYNCRQAFRRVSPLDKELLDLKPGERHKAVEKRMQSGQTPKFRKVAA